MPIETTEIQIGKEPVDLFPAGSPPTGGIAGLTRGEDYAFQNRCGTLLHYAERPITAFAAVKSGTIHTVKDGEWGAFRVDNSANTIFMWSDNVTGKVVVSNAL